MSDKLVGAIIVLYLAIGLVVVGAMDEVLNSSFNGLSLICIFIWPVMIFIFILFETIHLLYTLGEWIGEKISKWL